MAPGFGFDSDLPSEIERRRELAEQREHAAQESEREKQYWATAFTLCFRADTLVSTRLYDQLPVYADNGLVSIRLAATAHCQRRAVIELLRLRFHADTGHEPGRAARIAEHLKSLPAAAQAAAQAEALATMRLQPIPRRVLISDARAFQLRVAEIHVSSDLVTRLFIVDCFVAVQHCGPRTCPGRGQRSPALCRCSSLALLCSSTAPSLTLLVCRVCLSIVHCIQVDDVPARGCALTSRTQRSTTAQSHRSTVSAASAHASTPQHDLAARFSWRRR